MTATTTIADGLQSLVDTLPIDTPEAHVLAVRRAYLRGHADQLDMRKAGADSGAIGQQLAAIGRATVGRPLERVR